MIDHLSYSSISSYLDCAEAWRRKYLEKEPTAITPALVFGSAFHETVEQIIAELSIFPQCEEPVMRNLPHVWSENWNKAIEDQVDWGMVTPEECFNDGIRLLSQKKVKDAIRTIRAGQDEEGVKIERKIKLAVPGVPIPIIGYIDIITEDGIPADFKTSSRTWSADKASNSLQSLFYLGAMNQMGIPVNWQFRHIIFVKTRAPQIQILTHKHHPRELFFLFDLIKRVWNGIENGVFPLNPNHWKCCRQYCDYYASCRGKYVCP